jgi:hypothetical protein
MVRLSFTLNYEDFQFSIGYVDIQFPLFSNLSILATKRGAVEVEGLNDVSIPDLKKANQWYCRGRRARSTSWTNVNDVSSRSHWWAGNLFQPPTFNYNCMEN